MTLVWSSSTGALTLQSPTTNDPLLDLNTQPSLDLQFATSKTLDDRVSGLPLVDHQRDASGGKSAGTYVGSDGLIKTSTVNLVYPSESIDAGVGLWSTTTASGTIAVTPNYEQSPYGTNTATRVEATKSGTTGNEFAILQVQPSISGTSVGSIWIKSNTGSNQTIYFRVDLGGSEDYNLTVTPEWQRYEMVEDEGAGTCFFSVGLRGGSDNSCDISIWGAQLEEGSTATTYIPTTNLPSAAPRFDHDPATGESLGLLIEESRTNLLSYSEEFDQSVWTVKNSPILALSSDTAPDGSLTAWDFTRASGASNTIYQSVTVDTSKTYTYSMYVRAKSGTVDFQLVAYDTAGRTSSIFTAGTEWQRFSFTLQPAASATFFYLADPETNFLDTAFNVWGAQLEEGAFPTSYIPTSGSTVTRAADNAEITGTNFSSWYNQSEGTVFVEAEAAPLANTVVACFSSGSSNRIEVRSTAATIDKARGTMIVGGGTEYESDVLANSDYRKIVLGYSSNSTRFAADGTLGLLDTSVTVPATDNLYLGNNVFLTAQRPGHIKRLAYYPYRLPDATLQEITS